MDRKELYNLCSECKYAERSKGGRAIGCLVESPKIEEGSCKDYMFWWTKPPEKSLKGVWIGLAIALSVILLGIPLFIFGLTRLVRFIAPKVNKDSLSLYFPRRQ